LSGAQTIATTLTAWLIVTALGFAACSRAEAIELEPAPAKPCCDSPLRLADTKVVLVEVFSDDAIYRFEQQCSAEGGELFGRGTFVHCERGGPAHAGWMRHVRDVPDELRGVK
jgi:hypothetical protein